MDKVSSPPTPSGVSTSVNSPGLRPPGRAVRSVEEMLELRRIGVVMTADSDRPEEAWGVLNPALARSRDGEAYLFPRVVATGNYSRIAIATVEFDPFGNPAGVKRLGIALEPRESYEVSGTGTGGVEDPRITYLPLLDVYVMTYVALGPPGPRIALAASKDLHTWARLGLMYFEPAGGVDFNRCNNKDCVIFPVPVANPHDRPAIALLHRPIYLVSNPDGTTEWQVPAGIHDRRPSIWISYVPVDEVQRDITALTHVRDHHRVARPLGYWENHHIGAGAPPILTEEGWLLYYHGVVGTTPAGVEVTPGHMMYQSGVMLLDRNDPRRVLYRSSRPVLLPELANEQQGIVPNVVFPTAVDVRGHRVDVYYGAADERIATATTELTASVLLAPAAPWRDDATESVAGEIAVGRDTQGETGVRGVAPNPSLAGETLARVSPKTGGARPLYGHILVALDGSNFAEQVLAQVEPLARQFGSRVTLLRAVPPPRADEDGSGQAAPAGESDARGGALRYLTAMQLVLSSRGLTVEAELVEGAASDAILRRAGELRVDLIALTTHGRTGMDRMLLGSVAEDVIRQAPCPILLVRVLTSR